MRTAGVTRVNMNSSNCSIVCVYFRSFLCTLCGHPDSRSCFVSASSSAGGARSSRHTAKVWKTSLIVTHNAALISCRAFMGLSIRLCHVRMISYIVGCKLRLLSPPFPRLFAAITLFCSDVLFRLSDNQCRHSMRETSRADQEQGSRKDDGRRAGRRGQPARSRFVFTFLFSFLNFLPSWFFMHE